MNNPFRKQKPALVRCWANKKKPDTDCPECIATYHNTCSTNPELTS